MRDHERGRRHGPGGRPPWWPEDEPFPPRDGWGGRRRFLRRMALAAGVFLLLLLLASALTGALLWHTVGDVPHHRGAPFAGGLLGLLVVVGGLVLVVRFFRRAARPLQEVMNAADRVAAGDYDVRLREQGFGEMRRLARSFNEMTERLGAAERRRRELLADLAHELRTPLSVIQGNTEGMLDGLYPMDRAHLDPVLEETRVMSRLLEDLQTLSTAEAGALRLHREQVEPGALVEDAAAAFGSQAETAGVTLETDVSPGLPALDVDPMRIGEVLSNLLSNALRHTPSGGTVTISAALQEQDVVFRVTDTGGGIPAEALPDVFDRFVKGEGSHGAGLGLAIAKSLVEAHGGELTARSEPGQGTTMRFVLPLG